MSADSEGESTGYVAPEFREYSLGTLGGVEHRDVHRHAGLVRDEQVERLLSRCVEAYEPLDPEMPASFWETELATKILRSEGTKTARVALESGQHDTLDYITGLVGYESDASGMKALLSLQDLVENTPVFISYIYGLMGSGKTDFSLLLTEVFEAVYGDITLVTNFDVSEQDEEIHRWSVLQDRMEDRLEQTKAGNEPDDRLVVIIDEAAQVMTGSGSDQQKAKRVAKMLKLARKSQTDVILIGQDGKDIGPSLRSLCTMMVEKQSQKKAVFWRDVKDREGQDKITELSGVPPTDITYNTYDEGAFTFDDDGGSDDADLEELEKEHERRMMAVLDLTSDSTQSEIADTYDVSEKTVRRARQEYESELRDEGLV